MLKRPVRLFLIIIQFLLISALQLHGFQLKLLKSFENWGMPKSIMASPNGKYAVSMNLEDCSIWIMDTQTLKIKQKVNFKKTAARGWNYDRKVTIPSVAEKPVECDFTDNGRFIWLSFHNGSSVVVYDTEMDTMKKDMAQELAAKFGYELQEAQVEDLENNTKTTVYLPKIKVGKTPKTVRPTADGTKILVSNWHGSSVSVIDRKLMKTIKEVKLGGGHYIPRGLIITSDSKTAYIGEMSGDAITEVDLDTYKITGDYPITGCPGYLVITKDNNYIYYTTNEPDEKGAIMIAKVWKWNTKTKKNEAFVRVGLQARTLAITPDNKYLIDGAQHSGELYVLDADTLKIVAKYLFARPVGLSVTPDGTQLWVSSYGGGYLRVYQIIE